MGAIQQKTAGFRRRSGGWNYGFALDPAPYSTYKRNMGPSPNADYQPIGTPNRHLCTGKCKEGVGGGDNPCDSEGFCIDSGCGSVIRGGSQCNYEGRSPSKSKKRPRSNNHTPPIPLPSTIIPSLGVVLPDMVDKMMYQHA